MQFLIWSSLPDPVRYCLSLWKTEVGGLTLKVDSLPVWFCPGFGIPVLLQTVLLNTMTWHNGQFLPRELNQPDQKYFIILYFKQWPKT